MSLILRELNEEDEAAFLEGYDAYRGESPHFYTFEWKPGIPFLEHLERLRKNSRGEDLRADLVPETRLYAFVDGKIVGRVSLRHTLNQKLRERGGHIGYSVAPAYRGRGYATEMFRQSIPHFHRLGIQRVMITCDHDNEPSWRLLERVGAELAEIFFDKEDGKLARRYFFTPGVAEKEPGT